MEIGLGGIVRDLSELAEDLACPRHGRHNSGGSVERTVPSPPSLSNGVDITATPFS